jgi:hypothetical protein
MAREIDEIYHIHQYHLNINFMTAPTRPRFVQQRERRNEIQLNAARGSTDTDVQQDSEIEDGFHEIILESENEKHPEDPTSIENDYYDENDIKRTCPRRETAEFSDPHGEFNTYKRLRGIRRKRMRQWSENDLYIPEMRKYYEANFPPIDTLKINTTKQNNNGVSNDGLEDSIYNCMDRVNEELNSHTQQIKKIVDDVQHLQKVRLSLFTSGEEKRLYQGPESSQLQNIFRKTYYFSLTQMQKMYHRLRMTVDLI